MAALSLNSPNSRIFHAQPHLFLPFHHSSSPLLTCSPPPISSSSFSFLCRPLTTTFCASVSAHNHRRTTDPWLAQVPEGSISANTTTAPEAPPEEGPIEIPSSGPSIFANSDKPTPIQTATSVLLTGAVTVFLFRSIRRRAKRAKELKLRSSAAKKTLKEEALENLKVLAPTPIDAKSTPSPVQALLGGLTAGAMALILYKFTTTVEAALNQQPLSNNFSVSPLVNFNFLHAEFALLTWLSSTLYALKEKNES